MIPSPRLETFLVVSYDNDLDELKQTLSVDSRPNGNSTSKEKEKPKRDVRIKFGLDIEEEGAEEHRETVEVALGCAVRDGMFEFLASTPELEVYPRVWNLTA